MSHPDIDKAINELHEYIDETIDGVNQINSVYEKRIAGLEQDIKQMKKEFGEVMLQLHRCMKELIITDQKSKKEQRDHIRKLSSYMLQIATELKQ